MNAHKHIYKETSQVLAPHRRQGASLTAIWCILVMIFVMAGAVLQKRLLPIHAHTGAISLYDVILPIMLICATIVCVPLRNNTDRWIGTVTGVLTECDCGFLDCSGRIWLWYRRVCVTIFADLMLLFSFVPTLLLGSGAILCVRYGALQADSTIALFTALHLLVGSILFLSLPLRIWCAMAALPLCYLKQPHRSAFTIWRYALRCTQNISYTLLCNRLITIILFLIPFYGYIAFPKLLASEMLLCDRVRQRYLPDL